MENRGNTESNKPPEQGERPEQREIAQENLRPFLAIKAGDDSAVPEDRGHTEVPRSEEAQGTNVTAEIIWRKVRGGTYIGEVILGGLPEGNTETPQPTGLWQKLKEQWGPHLSFGGLMGVVQGIQTEKPLIGVGTGALTTIASYGMEKMMDAWGGRRAEEGDPKPEERGQGAPPPQA